MGRELQKKKNRSSTPRTVQKSSIRKRNANKAVILNNALIAANWDKKQTLAQNYARLGLARKLNGSTGGVDPLGVSGEGKGRKEDVLDIRRVKRGREALGGGDGGMVGVGEVRIVRDKEGRIVKVLEDKAEQASKKKAHWAGRLDDPLRALESDESASDLNDDNDDAEDDFASFSDDDKADRNGRLQHTSSLVGHKTSTAMTSDDPPDSIIAQLTAAASIPGAKKVRKQSEREAEWCAALVAKHGRDYAAMARDAKLNVMQQSVGDVKRRVQKYLKSV